MKKLKLGVAKYISSSATATNLVKAMNSIAKRMAFGKRSGRMNVFNFVLALVKVVKIYRYNGDLVKHYNGGFVHAYLQNWSIQNS